MREITIGGTRFLIRHIDALESAALLPRIVPIVTEIFVSFLGALPSPPPVDGEEDEGGAEVSEDAAEATPDPKKAIAEIRQRVTASRLGKIAEKFGIADLDMDRVTPIVARVCAQLPPDELKEIITTLLRETAADEKRLFPEKDKGGKAHFDKVMAGRTLDTFRLLWEAVKVVYADFFELLGGSNDA